MTGTLRQEADCLICAIGEIGLLAEQVQRQAERLLELIDCEPAGGDDGEQLLEQLALEEARCVLRDLVNVVIGGGEFQIGGLLGCGRDLAVAFAL